MPILQAFSHKKRPDSEVGALLRLILPWSDSPRRPAARRSGAVPVRPSRWECDNPLLCGGECRSPAASAAEGSRGRLMPFTAGTLPRACPAATRKCSSQTVTSATSFCKVYVMFAPPSGYRGTERPRPRRRGFAAARRVPAPAGAPPAHRLRGHRPRSCG